MDDNRADCKLTREMLRKLPSVSLLTAPNGRAALELAQQHAPCIELALVDIRLPDINGFEVLHAMRAMPLLATVPAIAISAYDMRDYKLQYGEKEDFDVYMAKPIMLGQFITTVKSLLKIDCAR